MLVTLSADLRQVVPEALARQAIADQIVQEANPHAYTSEIGPGRPLPTPSPGRREAVVEATKRDFVQGRQVSVSVGAVICAPTMVLLWTVPRRGSDPASEAG
ncbi:hypothetical protein QMZ92_17030 [Streptomyces sp. HNM0645]|uniref:hypothetical protein n=1 Tax=Streptomyces sp. HNM0645 TaxID=2782343 RepID=UPI0024B71766|nr:hypothetical protein [Streptomyces sp. HNM0645]MDI9886036.1 hypothetical protein [Streptomyces sp. HNM0645]